MIVENDWQSSEERNYVSDSVDWLVRYGHVLAGAIWVGGYAALALIVVPLLARDPSETLQRLAGNLVRMLTYIGTATILFGLILITRTRGFGQLLDGEWGMIIIASAIIAVALLGLGDSALRPALRRIPEGDDVAAAQRLAWIGFILTIIVIGLMTRAVYAPS
jgi:putative copper export protein